MTATRTVLLTSVAMLAFAGNSVLCRVALGQGLIDAATFTSVRAVSGAIVLALILLPRGRFRAPVFSDWCSAAMLFCYMACFSFAYLSLGTGTGALILFGSVQMTMILAALREGERFSTLSWVGFLVAVLGLAWMVFPGVTAPDPLGAVLMAGAGIAWGIYSLFGRGSRDPIDSTGRNFILCVPMVLIVSLLFLDDFRASSAGLVLAISSGAITSGLGYVIWYAALRDLTATRAATVQLTVPVLAAFGGVLWLSEAVTVRLVLASAAILGGVWVVLTQRAQATA
jgi:drug/metabolite transporter (DMT)-like permease